MNIYVGNIPHSMGDDALKQVFEEFGSVSSVKIITDKFTGSSRGFGFVEMSSDAEARAAIGKLNGTEIGGRRLTVNEARPQQEAPRSRPRRF